MSESDDNSIEEIFDLTVEDPCANNEITQIGTNEDILHYLSGSASTYVSLNIDNPGACTLTYQLYFWDAPNYTWELYDSSTASTYPFVSSFSTGTITIFSNDYTNYENFSIRTKLLAIDERSGSS